MSPAIRPAHRTEGPRGETARTARAAAGHRGRAQLGPGRPLRLRPRRRTPRRGVRRDQPRLPHRLRPRRPGRPGPDPRPGPLFAADGGGPRLPHGPRLGTGGPRTRPAKGAIRERRHTAGRPAARLLPGDRQRPRGGLVLAGPRLDRDLGLAEAGQEGPLGAVRRAVAADLPPLRPLPPPPPPRGPVAPAPPSPAPGREHDRAPRVELPRASPLVPVPATELRVARWPPAGEGARRYTPVAPVRGA